MSKGEHMGGNQDEPVAVAPQYSRAILELGFPEPLDVSGLRSIANPFGSTKKRCGIYLLVLPGDRYYIGQALDAVRRFSQHVLTHEVILGFTFLATPKTKLDDRERELIFRAELAGLTLVNVVHVSDIVVASDLEALIEPSRIEAWLRSPIELNLEDLKLDPIELSQAQLARQEQKFEALKRNPLFVPAAYLLYLYLKTAVPYPRTTEYSFWSVSCMPSTNRSSWPRLLCVSASVMELFVVGEYKDPKCAGFTWGFVNVAADALFSSFGSEDGFARAHPHVEVRKLRYRDAGQHQVNLGTVIQNDMLALLDDSRVTQAAGVLCLRLMRKRASIYSKRHCVQLVDLALGMHQLPAEELERLKDLAFPSEDAEGAEAGEMTQRLAVGETGTA